MGEFQFSLDYEQNSVQKNNVLVSLIERKERFMNEIVNRRSVRSYSEKQIDNGVINKLLEAARLSPSGSNTQPWHFIVVKSAHLKEEIVKVDHNQKWMLQAPAFIVCVADIRSRIQNDQPIILNEDSPFEELKQIIRDTSIAAEHIVLTAENLGLSTCWTAWFRQNAIRPILNIPSDKYVVCVITVGYSSDKPAPRPRKSIEKLVHYEMW